MDGGLCGFFRGAAVNDELLPALASAVGGAGAVGNADPLSLMV